MSAAQIDSALHPVAGPAPTAIPPRTSSHGAAFVSQSPPESSSSAAAATAAPSAPLVNLSGNVSPPHRRSSKRPVSTTSENWLAQSSGKKPLTAVNSTAMSSDRGDKGSRRHSHSHRPKSAHPSLHPNKLLTSTLEHAGSSPPPQGPSRTIGDDHINPKYTRWPAEKEKILLGPFDYLYGHPGKDIRSQCIAAFNEWLRVPDAKLAVITKVVGMLHTASLLVDDVEDSSLLRRGVPVAHSIFGIPQVINSANYVYFLALQELSTLNNPLALKIYTEELLNLHRGQGMDLYWRDSLTCPTESDYLEMVSNKTGGLFRLAIKLMQAESSIDSVTSRHLDTTNTSEDPDTTTGATASHTSAPPPSSTVPPAAAEVSCIPLINTIGLLFQILDDYLNLASPTYTARKGHAEDLTEGKFSFPVIHAIRSDPSNLVLLNVLRQKTTDLEVKKYAVEYMESRGSFEYTKRAIAELEKKAVREVGRLEARIGGEAGASGAERIRVILGRLKAL